MVEFVQLTTECCWGQPSDPCQRGCLTSHACVMWGPRTLNADDDDGDKVAKCWLVVLLVYTATHQPYDVKKHTFNRVH